MREYYYKIQHKIIIKAFLDHGIYAHDEIAIKKCIEHFCRESAIIPIRKHQADT